MRLRDGWERLRKSCAGSVCQAIDSTSACVDPVFNLLPLLIHAWWHAATGPVLEGQTWQPAGPVLVRRPPAIVK